MRALYRSSFQEAKHFRSGDDHFRFKSRRCCLSLNKKEKDVKASNKQATWARGRESVLETEEHSEQNLLSAGAIQVAGANNHLKMLGYQAAVMISI